jgi:hypothetical protein
MENKIITEIRRINEIMNGKVVIYEQIVPAVLKKIFNQIDDDLIKKMLKSGDNSYDDIIKKLKAGETLSDDTINLLLKVIDFDSMAKIMINKKLLGTKVDIYIEKIINILKENPSRYDEFIVKLGDDFNNYGSQKELPQELIDSIIKVLKDKIDDSVPPTTIRTDVTPVVRNSKIANFGAKVFKKLPLISRNLKTIISILVEQKKGIEILKEEINGLFNSIIKDENTLKKLKRDLENKLATIERISDGSAQKVLDEISAGYKQLLLKGKITKVDFDSFERDKKVITTTKFWNEFIAPNYKELDDQVDGLGNFFKNGLKAFQPISIKISRNKGVLGYIPKITKKEGARRLFNFLAFNSAQTGADILKRLIKSNPTEKPMWIVETYVRAIGPQLIIPFANAAFWTIWIPSTEFLQEGADFVGLDVEWDIYNSTFSELLTELWIENLFNILKNDPESTKTLELSDLKPLLNSILWKIIVSFGENDDYIEPQDNIVPTSTTPQDTGDPTSQSTSTSEPAGAFVPTFQNFKELYYDENAIDLGNGIFQLSGGEKYKWNGEFFQKQ